MLELLKSIDAFAWGPPLLILLVGTGIYLTMRLGLLQVLRLPKAFQLAAAAAKTNEPVEQGLISMTGTFIDTLIICTLTGLTILVTGVWSGDLNGVALTQSAFSTVFSHFGPALLTIFLVLFAFTTILGWNYYGERCFEFLFGVRFIWLYRVVFVLMVLLGGFIELDMVWIIADIVNALMALPNLIALLVLSPVVIAETKKYFDK